MKKGEYSIFATQPGEEAGEEGVSYLHVTLMGVHSVKKGFWGHPLDWKSPLQVWGRKGKNR